MCISTWTGLWCNFQWHVAHLDCDSSTAPGVKALLVLDKLAFWPLFSAGNNGSGGNDDDRRLGFAITLSLSQTESPRYRSWLSWRLSNNGRPVSRWWSERLNQDNHPIHCCCATTTTEAWKENITDRQRRIKGTLGRFNSRSIRPSIWVLFCHDFKFVKY